MQSSICITKSLIYLIHFKIKSLFQNDAFPDTVLWTDLVAFAYADGMLLILFRPSSMIKT